MTFRLFSLALVTGVLMQAATVAGPCVTFQVDGQSRTLCGSLGPDGKTFEVDLLKSTEGPLDINDSNGALVAQILSLTIAGNIDPTLSYGVAVLDLGAPSTFSFTFNMLVAPDSYTHAFSTISGSLTDAGSDGASASPISPALVLQTSTAGVPDVDLGVGVGPACVGAAGVASVCPPSSLHNYAVSGGPFTTIAVNLSFAGSGGGDVITFSGRTDLDNQSAVPEPSTALLGAAALAALAMARRKR